ncbi:MAG: MBL fold metallo-hydrolase, partial [Prevotellaceae bacterium]|nr:MBL fold metallo-hydrolase [Prevotellaceae bacterium]
MKITSIIENTSTIGLPVEHGLSLYVQLDNGQNVLFDMGQRRLFTENAERLGLSISNVDTAI